MTFAIGQFKRFRFWLRMEVASLDRGFLLLMLGVVVTFAVTFAIGRSTHETKPASGAEETNGTLVLPSAEQVPASLQSAPPIASITPPPPKKAPATHSISVTPSVSVLSAKPSTTQVEPAQSVKAAAPAIAPSKSSQPSNSQPASKSGGGGSFDSSG